MTAELVPPPGLLQKHRVGGGDFAAIADRFLTRFVDHGGLTPSSFVLEIGSGLGRMAYGLREYLDIRGEYRGFDVNADAVDWVESRWGRELNFGFAAADVQNGWYNPNGAIDGASYRFDFDDGYFDMVLAISVFTHVRQSVHDRYLAEAARVLRPGGRMVATYHVLTEQSRQAISDRTPPDIVPLAAIGDGPEYSSNAKTPEACIGFDQEYLLDAWQRAGLRLVDGIRHGFWAGRSGGEAFHDLVVLER